MRPTDEHLFARFRAGDPHAFAHLFHRTAHRVHSAALKLRVPGADVEDVVQETFIAAFLHADEFDTTKAFAHWLQGILRHKVLDARRRRARRKLDPTRLNCNEVRADRDEAATRELLADLSASIEAQPRKYAEVLRLHYLQALSADDIAARLDRPASTVRTQIQRGTARLRDRLGRHAPPGVLVLLALPHLTAQSRGPAEAGAPSTAAPAPRVPTNSARWMALALLAVLGVSVWYSADDRRPATGRTPKPESPGSTSTAVAAATARQPAHPGVGRDESGPGRGHALEFSLVRATDGRPIAGATVALEEWDGRHDKSPAATLESLRHATTDAEGRVVFDGVPTGLVRLRYGDTGFTRFTVERSGHHRIEIGFAATVTGRVVDAEGRPRAGAEVWSATGPAAAMPAALIARSDARGRYAATFVHRADTLLWARAGGAAASPMASVALTSAAHHDLDLQLRERPCRVLADVVDAGGAPLENATLGLYPSGDARLVDAPALSRSDAQGRARFDGIAAGDYVLVAVGAGDALGWQALRVDGTRTSTRVQLHRNGALAGRVTDPTGRGIADLSVAVRPAGGALENSDANLLWRTATTDSDGRYSVAAVPAGDALLVVGDAAGDSVWGTERRELHRGDNHWDVAIDIASVRGTVDAVGGERLAGSVVQAIRIDGGLRRCTAMTTTDANGEFELPLPRGSDFVLAAFSPGRGPRGGNLPVVWLALQAPSTPLQLTATEARPTGRVRAALVESRAGSQGLSLRLEPIGYPWPRAWPLSVEAPLEIERVPAGAYRAWLCGIGGERHLGTIELGPGDTHDFGELSPLQFGVACIRVLAPSGSAPLRGVELCVRDLDGRTAHRAQLGAPAIDLRLAAGEYRLRARADGHTTGPHTLIIEPHRETRRSVTLRPAAQCDIVLRTGDGPAAAPPRRARLRIFAPGGELIEDLRATSTAGSQFAFRALLPPGNYTLRADTSWGAVAGNRIVIAECAPLRIDLQAR